MVFLQGSTSFFPRPRGGDDDDRPASSYRDSVKSDESRYEYYWVSPSYLVLPSFTGLNWVLLGSTKFLLGFTGFYLVFTEFY